MAASTPYEVVVLDVMLPDLDGFAVCRELRAQDIWTPVLMLTARDAVADRVAGLDVGADDYLLKPFAVDELLARLRALVRRGAQARPAVLEAGDLRLDPAAGVAWCRGDELALSPKEFAMLEAFMRRPGELLTRDALLGLLWDHAYENRSNVVDVYVRYLREKIDRPVRRARRSSPSAGAATAWTRREPAAPPGDPAPGGRRLRARDGGPARRRRASPSARGCATRSPTRPTRRWRRGRRRSRACIVDRGRPVPGISEGIDDPGETFTQVIGPGEEVVVATPGLPRAPLLDAAGRRGASDGVTLRLPRRRRRSPTRATRSATPRRSRRRRTSRSRTTARACSRAP